MTDIPHEKLGHKSRTTSGQDWATGAQRAQAPGATAYFRSQLEFTLEAPLQLQPGGPPARQAGAPAETQPLALRQPTPEGTYA